MKFETKDRSIGMVRQDETLKRVACGYRDIECFVLRLLFLHETKLNLAGA